MHTVGFIKAKQNNHSVKDYSSGNFSQYSGADFNWLKRKKNVVQVRSGISVYNIVLHLIQLFPQS